MNPGSATTKLARVIARAIARQEGWLVPTSVQYKNRNPGNMMDIDHFKKTGQFRLNTFVSWEAGWEALATLIQRRLLDKKLTLLEFIGGQRDAKGNVIPGGYSGFAPAGHGANNPAAYAGNLSKWLGLPVNVPANIGWLNEAKPLDLLPRYGAQTPTDVSKDL